MSEHGMITPQLFMMEDAQAAAEAFITGSSRKLQGTAADDASPNDMIENSSTSFSSTGHHASETELPEAAGLPANADVTLVASSHCALCGRGTVTDEPGSAAVDGCL
jgi:hypothetical protein